MPPAICQQAGAGDVVLTVGRVESGIAIVITDDLQLLEVPASVLPTQTPGATLRLQVKEAADVQKDRLHEFMALQDRILAEFGNGPNSAAFATCLQLQGRTHTTLTVHWPTWEQMQPDCRSKVYSIIGHCHGKHLNTVSLSADATQFRLSGLEPDSDYKVKVTFETSAGKFESNELVISTPPLDDLSCLCVMLDRDVDPEIEGILRDELNVQCTRELDPDSTTHVVTNRSETDLGEGHDAGALKSLCTQLNIPIVTTEWVFACQKQRRMQSVSQFYSK